MTLAPQLAAVLENFEKNAPDAIKQPILRAKEDFSQAFDTSKSIQPGYPLPPFRLSNAIAEEISSADLLSKGPLLITFYRGEWCPFCNLAVAAFQKHLDDFTARGVTLVAISPELPNESLSMSRKHQLGFHVLSDKGNVYAGQLGLIHAQSDSLRPVFEKMGHDLLKRNGDDSFVVPVPATLLVDQKGIVKNMFINPDYTKRCEPEVVLEWIDALEA